MARDLDTRSEPEKTRNEERPVQKAIHSLYGKFRSPYVSTTTMPHVAEAFAERGGAISEIVVPKSAVVKGLDVLQAEYLLPSGTPVLSIRRVIMPTASAASTARWAAEAGIVVAAETYGVVKGIEAAVDAMSREDAK